jgi:CubicO group peptidase (beta-lactamase class C family)
VPATPDGGLPPVPIGGWCDPRFGSVRQEFADNFVERGEVGAGVCVMVDGTVVVDLVGGWSDAGRHRVWQPDTLVDVYSVGKPIVALLLLQQVAAGRAALDDPVSSVWPEFGSAGKSGATLRHALCHRAGVPAIRQPLTDDDLWDFAVMADALAATEPWWEPGARHAYHTNTYGHLVGTLVRRLGGTTCGAALRAVAGPLGADLWFGVPPEHLHRCAEITFVLKSATAGSENRTPDGEQPDGAALVADLAGHDRMALLSYVNPPGYSSIGVVNTTRWRAAEIPSTNGHATATGIARLYAALLEPDRLLPAGLLAEATSSQSEGPCPILGEEVVFGLGFVPTSSRRSFGPNPGSFGHFGTGGAVGFADPHAGVAFGYAMNHVIPRWQSSRNRALIDAVYRSL